jgi:hypothetical protein
MANNNFFFESGFLHKQSKNTGTVVIDCEEQSCNRDTLKDQICHFHLDSENFFKRYGKQGCEIVAGFLDKELIDTDPQYFTDLYHVLLRRIHFDCNENSLSLKTLWMIVLDKDGNCNHGTVEFLKETGLSRETIKILGFLEMDEETHKWQEIMTTIA